MNLLRCLLVVVGCLAWTLPAQAVPIMDLPDLDSITIYERSTAGGPDPYVFAPASSEILQRRADPLSAANSDFVGTPGEFYDVFYSDADGTANTLGEYDIKLEAGEVILSGSLVPLHPVVPGDVMTLAVGGMGNASVRFT